MARHCLDAYGHWQSYPRPGGWHEQDRFELDVTELAWRVWRMVRPLKHGETRDPKDAELLKWIQEAPDWDDLERMATLPAGWRLTLLEE